MQCNFPKRSANYTIYFHLAFPFPAWVCANRRERRVGRTSMALSVHLYGSSEHSWEYAPIKVKKEDRACTNSSPFPVVGTDQGQEGEKPDGNTPLKLPKINTAACYWVVQQKWPKMALSSMTSLPGLQILDQVEPYRLLALLAFCMYSAHNSSKAQFTSCFSIRLAFKPGKLPTYMLNISIGVH